MIPLTNKEISLIKSKKHAIYAKKKNFFTIKTRKKLETIVITSKNLEELLIANAI